MYIIWVNQKASKNYRERRRTTGKEVGRPSKYPVGDIHHAIHETVSTNTEIHAQDRRRSDRAEAQLGVSKLREKLAQKGFEYSRGATYNFLASRRQNTIEASRHHIGSTVHFYRPQNNLDSGHPHSHFANAQAKNTHEIAEFFNKEECSRLKIDHPVTFISYDNKAKVPLSLPVARSVTVLGVEGADVRLPNHNWSVAPGHSLIISGYATYTPHADKYYDNCFLVVGSTLHNPPSPVEHHQNLSHILHSINTSPVVVLQSDGGTDVNSRNSLHRMCLGYLAYLHQIELLIHFTRAPGDSPLNPVERTFAPLSRAMANEFYAHNFFGEHLNARKQVVDDQLCQKKLPFPS